MIAEMSIVRFLQAIIKWLVRTQAGHQKLITAVDAILQKDRTDKTWRIKKTTPDFHHLIHPTHILFSIRAPLNIHLISS